MPPSARRSAPSAGPPASSGNTSDSDRPRIAAAGMSLAAAIHRFQPRTTRSASSATIPSSSTSPSPVSRGSDSGPTAISASSVTTSPSPRLERARDERQGAHAHGDDQIAADLAFGEAEAGRGEQREAQVLAV